VDQNSLFELVAEYGDVYGTALPRDSSLLKTVDAAQNWLALSDALGSDRARQLAGNEGDPKPSEMQALIRWQADRALAVAGRPPEWSAFLSGHASGTPTRFIPRPAAMRTYAQIYDRYRRLVALHGSLEALQPTSGPTAP
jgi:hypothetical protein